MSSPVDKNELAEVGVPLRRTSQKAWQLGPICPPELRWRRHDLELKKPGTGVPPDRMADLLGRRVRKEVTGNELLSIEDLEPVI